MVTPIATVPSPMITKPTRAVTPVQSIRKIQGRLTRHQHEIKEQNEQNPFAVLTEKLKQDGIKKRHKHKISDQKVEYSICTLRTQHHVEITVRQNHADMLMKFYPCKPRLRKTTRPFTVQKIDTVKGCTKIRITDTRYYL